MSGQHPLSNPTKLELSVERRYAGDAPPDLLADTEHLAKLGLDRTKDGKSRV